MPVQRCKRSGQDGWRWGNSGFCYLGPDAKGKAMVQGAAIEASKARASAPPPSPDAPESK
jgi:hypothetical protein